MAGRVGWANWMNLTGTGGRSRRGTRAAAAGPASGHRRGPGAVASGQGRAGVAARGAPRTAGSLTGFYFSGGPARKDVSHGEAGVQPHAVGGAPPSAAPPATSCDLGACAAWPPVSPPGPRRPRLVLRAFASMAARRGVKTVTRPLQTGTWRLQSGGAGWRGPRHSVSPLHALTRGRRAPSAARGAFTLPWAPATRGREGGVRGLRSSSSYLGTQERNLVPRKTTLESQPEAGGRPPSRRRRAQLPLLAGGAPKWGPRGASSASLCAFCPLSLKTSACEGARDVRCERLWRHLSGGAWGPGSGPRTQTARAKAAAGYRGACSDSPQLAVGDVG